MGNTKKFQSLLINLQFLAAVKIQQNTKNMVHHSFIHGIPFPTWDPIRVHLHSNTGPTCHGPPTYIINDHQTLFSKKKKKKR